MLTYPCYQYNSKRNLELYIYPNTKLEVVLRATRHNTVQAVYSVRSTELRLEQRPDLGLVG